MNFDNGELIYEVSDKVVPGFSKAKEKLYVSVIGLTKRKKIAFVRIQEKNRSWELPGGAVLENETLIDAAEREFLEETGMKLNETTKVLTIKNVYENTDIIHSLVYVVVGVIDESIEPEKVVDSEIAECAFYDSAPSNCTFGQSYINELIKYAIPRFSVEKNHKMWNQAAESYDAQTDISQNDIHYGPIIPGESQLKLLPDLSNKSVLDLGCGAGDNLMALKNLGAQSGLGIDFCENQIEKAKKKLGTAFDAIVGDIGDKTLIKKEKFDIVISVFAMSFIDNLENFFNIIERNLKPGGCVIISTDHPNRKLSDDYEVENVKTNNHSRIRYWNVSNETSIPYMHYLHSFEDIYDAINKAGLVIDKVIEPKVVPLDEMEKAPYRSPYYINRYQEMLEEPYTIIFKAYKPLKEIT